MIKSSAALQINMDEQMRQCTVSALADDIGLREEGEWPQEAFGMIQ
jgi:hypothetical protein